MLPRSLLRKNERLIMMMNIVLSLILMMKNRNRLKIEDRGCMVRKQELRILVRGLLIVTVRACHILEEVEKIKQGDLWVKMTILLLVMMMKVIDHVQARATQKVKGFQITTQPAWIR